MKAWTSISTINVVLNYNLFFFSGSKISHPKIDWGQTCLRTSSARRLIELDERAGRQVQKLSQSFEQRCPLQILRPGHSWNESRARNSYGFTSVLGWGKWQFMLCNCRKEGILHYSCSICLLSLLTNQT